ncbi:MAG TPA: hypothetical protein PLW86_12350, partial [Rhodocyclaceae bacterium]|nr:hypothetical protein [Rhodocyclaceae bacterium]
QPYSGKTLAIVCGPLRLRLAITEAGQFATASAGEDDVLITLPADTPVRLVFDQPSVFARTTLQGRADFAEALSFVFKNLHWDAEADVARLTGDIVAYRLVRVARDFLSWHTRSLSNLTGNVSEFLVEEERLFALHRDLAGFAENNQRTANELSRLEERIGRLRR